MSDDLLIAILKHAAYLTAAITLGLFLRSMYLAWIAFNATFATLGTIGGR